MPNSTTLTFAKVSSAKEELCTSLFQTYLFCVYGEIVRK